MDNIKNVGDLLAIAEKLKDQNMNMPVYFRDSDFNDYEIDLNFKVINEEVGFIGSIEFMVN